MTFVMPQAELPNGDVTYFATLDGADGLVTQPEARIVGVITTPGDAPGSAETPQSFFGELSQSIATGNLTFAITRLHPNVIEAFGVEACTAALQSRVAPGYAIAVDAVGAAGPWTYSVPDGRTWDHPQAQSVTVRVPGTDEPAEAHLVLVDGTYRWFTICAPD